MRVELKQLREKMARAIAPAYFKDAEERAKTAEHVANQRVAQAVLSVDPFEMIMKKYHGVFSEEYDNPEQKLDARGQLLMKTLGYQLRDDPSFKYLTDWIMNTQGNAMIRAPARTNEERGEILMWGKAQIVSMRLLVKEIKRLGSLYDEMLVNGKDEFNSESTVE